MNIYQSIAAILNDVPAIGKNQKNATQGFMYRGIDVVMNHLQPLFAKHKVFVAPEVLNQIREERQTKSGSNLIYSVCTIRYTFYAEDGTSVSATVIGEGMDSGDKATNKAMAIAFKYACFQVFCIPTEEMKDPDADTPPESTPKDPYLDEPVICEDCGRTIEDHTNTKGKTFTKQSITQTSLKNHAKAQCYSCYWKEERAKETA
jgi:hypothetical protein